MLLLVDDVDDEGLTLLAHSPPFFLMLTELL